MSRYTNFETTVPSGRVKRARSAVRNRRSSRSQSTVTVCSRASGEICEYTVEILIETTSTSAHCRPCRYCCRRRSASGSLRIASPRKLTFIRTPSARRSPRWRVSTSISPGRMTLAVSLCICSLTSGSATPGTKPPNDWKPFISVRSIGPKKRGTPCTSRMCVRCSTARAGSLVRKAWSVMSASVALSDGVCSMRSSSACWRRSDGVCKARARSCRRRATSSAFCTAAGWGEAGSATKLPSRESSAMESGMLGDLLSGGDRKAAS